jgi:transposase-like protein
VSRRTPRRRGRKTLLTPDRKNRILELVEAGNHIATACAHVGIGTSTLYRWLDQAADVDEQIAQGQRPDVAKQVYVDFRDALALARAKAEVGAVKVIHRSMEGGFVISETPLQDASGDALRDDNGNILYSRTFTQPDGRLALAFLARSWPEKWGQNAQRVELSGPGGSPVQVQQVGQISALAQRLHEVAAARQADLELEAAGDDEVMDADVVEDESGTP